MISKPDISIRLYNQVKSVENIIYLSAFVQKLSFFCYSEPSAIESLLSAHSDINKLNYGPFLCGLA